MASDWLHGHTLATSNNTPPMPPSTLREREAWMEQERQWRGEGVVIEWKWLAKTSESQAPQQTHHSSNSHQVIHAKPQACYTTTKSHSSATHTPSGGKQEDRGGTRPACHNKVKHQQPWSFAITHTGSATIKPASPKGTWCWCLWQGSCHSLTHTPQGRGEPWLMTRGVHHGSSHSHTQVANTPATVQHALVHAMVSISHATHTHTKGRGPWIDGQSGIHNMPPLREREGLDGGQWTCERGQATCNTTGQKEAPLKPCSHHSSIHQQPPHHHTHHTSVVMVTHCLLTHSLTHEGQGRTRSTPPPSQWCGWLAQ